MLEQNDEVSEGKQNIKFILQILHFSILESVQPVWRLRLLSAHDALPCTTGHLKAELNVITVRDSVRTAQ
jgi:hypothetical protein